MGSWPKAAVVAEPHYNARDAIIGIERQLACRSLTIADLILDEAKRESEPKEIWDPETHALWFFHRHPDHQRFPGELGHFHTFLGAAGMPRGVQPFVLPEMAMEPQTGVQSCDPVTHLSRRSRGQFGHIVGVSVDARAQPIGLFTTNRWVTGEVWYRAEDMIRLLDRFHLQPTPSEAGEILSLPDSVSLWLMGVMAMLRPHIIALLTQRDDVIMDWRRRRMRQAHVFEDRRLQIPSSLEIDFQHLMESVSPRL